MKPRLPAGGLVRDRQKGRGQSLVEFAILVPVLATVLLIAVDVGRVYLGWVSLSNVARIGANFAASNPGAWANNEPAGQARYRSLMTKDAAGIDCTLPSTLPAPTFIDTSAPYALGSRVQVDLSCSFSLITPFLSNIVGDGAGHIAVGSSAVFTIRSGSIDDVLITGEAVTPTPSPSPTASPTPTATPTATATATPTATPSGATPGPTATASPTPEPRSVTFWGSSTSEDASGGGPPGSVDEDLIIGINPLTVTFNDTSTGPPKSSCDWDFGDGDTTSSCGNQVTHTYTTRGTFSVTLTIDGTSYTRNAYILVGCKVPAFAGVHKSNVTTNWSNAGFDPDNVSYLEGNGNYKVGYQSLAGGLVNPIGGCSGAEVTVGP